MLVLALLLAQELGHQRHGIQVWARDLQSVQLGRCYEYNTRQYDNMTYALCIPTIYLA